MGIGGKEEGGERDPVLHPSSVKTLKPPTTGRGLPGNEDMIIGSAFLPANKVVRPADLPVRRLDLCQATKTRQTVFVSISKNDLARHVGSALRRAAAIGIIHAIPVRVGAVIPHLVVLG